MEFRKWIMSEMAHLTMPVNIFIGGKEVVAIDMHFEFYPDDLFQKVKLWMRHFSAPIPGTNTYLNNIKGDVSIGPARVHRQAILPPDWWEYARVEYADGTEKPPTRGPHANLEN